MRALKGTENGAVKFGICYEKCVEWGWADRKSERQRESTRVTNEQTNGIRQESVRSGHSLPFRHYH